MEPNRLEPCASNSNKDGDNTGVSEGEKDGHVFTTDW